MLGQKRLSRSRIPSSNPIWWVSLSLFLSLPLSLSISLFFSLSLNLSLSFSQSLSLSLPLSSHFSSIIYLRLFSCHFNFYLFSLSFFSVSLSMSSLHPSPLLSLPLSLLTHLLLTLLHFFQTQTASSLPSPSALSLSTSLSPHLSSLFSLCISLFSNSAHTKVTRNSAVECFGVLVSLYREDIEMCGNVIEPLLSLLSNHTTREFAVHVRLSLSLPFSLLFFFSLHSLSCFLSISFLLSIVFVDFSSLLPTLTSMASSLTLPLTHSLFSSRQQAICRISRVYLSSSSSLSQTDISSLITLFPTTASFIKQANVRLRRYSFCSLYYVSLLICEKATLDNVNPSSLALLDVFHTFSSFLR